MSDVAGDSIDSHDQLDTATTSTKRHRNSDPDAMEPLSFKRRNRMKEEGIPQGHIEKLTIYFLFAYQVIAK